MKKLNYCIDTTVAEVAVWWMRKKHIALTTGNLFVVMHRILKRVDLINKNSRRKIIKFSDGVCEYLE